MYTAIPLFIVFHIAYVGGIPKWSYEVFDFEEDAWDFYREWLKFETDLEEKSIERPFLYVNGEVVRPDAFDYTKVEGGEQICMFH